MRLPFHRSSAMGGPRPGVPATLHSSTRQQHLARSLRDPREGHNARYLEGEGAAVRRARLGSGLIYQSQKMTVAARATAEQKAFDRKSVVSGTRVSVSVDLGGGRIFKKKKYAKHI